MLVNNLSYLELKSRAFKHKSSFFCENNELAKKNFTYKKMYSSKLDEVVDELVKNLTPSKNLKPFLKKIILLFKYSEGEWVRLDMLKLANELGCHRNTVRNLLNKFQDLKIVDIDRKNCISHDKTYFKVVSFKLNFDLITKKYDQLVANHVKSKKFKEKNGISYNQAYQNTNCAFISNKDFSKEKYIDKLEAKASSGFVYFSDFLKLESQTRLDDLITRQIYKTSRYLSADSAQVLRQLRNFVEKNPEKKIFGKNIFAIKAAFYKWVRSFIENEKCNFAWGNVGTLNKKKEIPESCDKPLNPAPDAKTEPAVNLPDPWQHVINTAIARHGKNDVNAWLLKCQYSNQDGLHYIKAPSSFFASYIKNRFESEIARDLNCNRWDIIIN